MEAWENRSRLQLQLFGCWCYENSLLLVLKRVSRCRTTVLPLKKLDKTTCCHKQEKAYKQHGQQQQ